MQLARATLLIAIFGAFSCGGDDDDDVKDKVLPCPDLSGFWTITDHCTASNKGKVVPITQTACTISTGGDFAGLSGPVDADGQFQLTGRIGLTSLTCDGLAADKRITESCSGCGVVLTR